MKSRSQQFLDAINAGDPSLLPNPITREERFMHALSTGEEITPTTFEEQFLQAARAFKGLGGGGTSIEDLLSFSDTSEYQRSAPVGELGSDIVLNYIASKLPVSKIFKFFYDSSYIYLFSSTGTYIDDLGGVFTSDGEMETLSSSGTITNRGTLVDWSTSSPKTTGKEIVIR